MISALQQTLPHANIMGCYFHFTQSLWRKVQSMGLVRSYRESSELRLTIRRCAALAFMKPEDMDEGWLYIHENAPGNPNLTQFLDYFVDQWMENPVLPPNIWSCYGRRHRTTNSVEGWHHKLNSRLGRSHPKIREVINCLKTEAESSNLRISRERLNLECKRRKMCYIKQDERIQRATLAYEESGDVPRFLNTICHVLKLD